MSYSDTLTTDLDRIRSILQDTDTPELHSDEHITAVLSAQGGSIGLAVAYLAHELVARIEQDPDTFTDPSGKFTFGERLKTWRLLAAPYLASITATAQAAAAAANTSSPFSFVTTTARYGRTSTTDEYGRTAEYD